MTRRSCHRLLLAHHWIHQMSIKLCCDSNVVFEKWDCFTGLLGPNGWSAPSGNTNFLVAKGPWTVYEQSKITFENSTGTLDKSTPLTFRLQALACGNTLEIWKMSWDGCSWTKCFEPCRPPLEKCVPEASTLVGFGSALAMTGPGLIGWLRRRRL